MGEAASDPDDGFTAGPDAAGARGLGSTVSRSDAARANHQEDRANLAAGSPLFFRQAVSLSSERLCPQNEKRREHHMRLLFSLASDRFGSRHLMLGAETLLAMTVCLLVLRAVTQL